MGAELPVRPDGPIRPFLAAAEHGKHDDIPLLG